MNNLENYGIIFHQFDDHLSLVDGIKEATLERLKTRLDRDGTATWAVSGGSTPAPLFASMAQTAFAWQDVHVALVDERWVKPSHPRSNQRFIKSTLLKGHAAEAQFTGMYRCTATPGLALGEVEAAYGALPAPFANILLGMGSDGHTASLFPDANGLEAALAPDYFALCAAIKAQPSAITGDELDRMTLTLNAIKQADSCFLMITGDQKLKALKTALEHDTHLPVARVVRSLKQPLEVYWSP